MNKEVWTPIKELPHYHVSSYGRVKNTRTNKTLQAWANSSGYYQVRLSDGATRIMKTVHRLVAEQFIPNPKNKATVNHKDCTRLNCEVSNLEWATVEENNQHAIDNGLQFKNKRH